MSTTPTPGKGPRCDADICGNCGHEVVHAKEKPGGYVQIPAGMLTRTAAERDRLQAENAALVAALSWYAHPDSWKPGNYGTISGWHRASNAELERGERARAALAAHAARTEGEGPR